jgi:hypothetical protein
MIRRTAMGWASTAALGTLAIVALLLVSTAPAGAAGTGLVFVANEKSSTITVLDREA